ncbi:MAG: MBL fold metallo-hydrolase [Dysgonamonadaceae bacterium]|jgi:phosphoribosyl 1,2-cyclic phosphate phosphodiesterase|nr:MBL fold metallo-hydrolase [Dysgonamonadaceae bacterium]
MKIRFLGTGTSTGNPEIGCSCEVCTSSDKRDERLRASVLIETDGKRLLIDCGPDFRQQMLCAQQTEKYTEIDGVLLTHEHYDHVGGLDDLRVFCAKGAVEIFAEDYVAQAIRTRIAYVFKEHKYPGVPNLRMNEIGNAPFSVAGINIIPIRLLHGRLPILGYRIADFAYLTDLKTIPEEEYAKLENLDVLVINALRHKEHISHQTVADAIRQVEKIKPKQTYLTHVSHHFGLHSVMEKTLPETVAIAYDGLEILMI